MSEKQSYSPPLWSRLLCRIDATHLRAAACLLFLARLPVMDAGSVEAGNDSGKWQKYETITPDHDGKPDDVRNSFGGLASPKVAENGYFRVLEHKHCWWLIDPTGALFISIGVNSVSPYRADRDHEISWADETKDLLDKGGFNTLGRWSKPEPFAERKKPVAWCSALSFMAGYSHQRPKKYGPGGKLNAAMPVFDPEWPEFCQRYAKEHAGPLAQDSWLIGHFSDNELPFRPDALQAYLSQPASDPGHAAAIEWLKDHPISSENPNDPAAKASFLQEVARRYYSTVAAALRQADPHHLYLGSRIHGLCISEPVIRGSAACDVISINYYHRWLPEPKRLATWTAWSGRPILISEFYAMTVTNRQVKPEGAGFRVMEQDDAVKFYQTFTASLLKEVPNCVGWHWFKYRDDSPDWHKGVVGEDGSPHQALMDGMHELNRRAYSLRGGW